MGDREALGGYLPRDVRVRAFGRRAGTRLVRAIPALLPASFVALASAPAAPALPVCPPHMVLATQSVCIDQYEWPGIPGRRPQLGLSGIAEPQDLSAGRVLDAERLCASVGKRVCTADEWTSACLGPERAAYPWGPRLPRFTPGDGSGICNYDRRFRAPDEQLVHRRDREHLAWLDQSEPVGTRRACRSEVGAYDMIGNAEEWVRCSWGVEGWCLAGRFWAEPRACTAMVPSHSPRWHYYNTSFRCCQDAPRRRGTR